MLLIAARRKFCVYDERSPLLSEALRPSTSVFTAAFTSGLSVLVLPPLEEEEDAAQKVELKSEAEPDGALTADVYTSPLLHACTTVNLNAEQDARPVAVHVVLAMEVSEEASQPVGTNGTGVEDAVYTTLTRNEEKTQEFVGPAVHTSTIDDEVAEERVIDVGAAAASGTVNAADATLAELDKFAQPLLLENISVILKV